MDVSVKVLPSESSKLGPSESSNINSFLNKIKPLLDSNSSLVSCIRDKNGLFLALLELDNLVEMDDLKESILEQVKFLLIKESAPKKSTSGGKFEGHMLHTVIYGPPGVGKTSVGIILAKIWLSLGLIKPQTSHKNSGSLSGDSKYQSSLGINIQKILIDALYMHRIIKLRNEINSYQGKIRKIHSNLDQASTGIKQVRRKMIDLKPIGKTENDTKWDSVFEDSRKLRGQIDAMLHETSIPVIETSNPLFTQVNQSPTGEVDSEIIISSNDESRKPSDLSQIIKIVSRSDFVGEYVGQTAPKTEKLLHDNKGKVLFIDESYSLVNSEKDSFGMEALTALNKFMSEYPDSLIILFAGYKEKMQETIFAAQPGLKRRCTWVFEIPGYSPGGLSKIFTQQLNSEGWSIDPRIDLNAFFAKNKDLFPSFGGDTHRFAFYYKLAYSSEIFNDRVDEITSQPTLDFTSFKSELSLVITMKMLKKALKKLNSNNTDTNSNMSSHPMYG